MFLEPFSEVFTKSSAMTMSHFKLSLLLKITILSSLCLSFIHSWTSTLSTSSVLSPLLGFQHLNSSQLNLYRPANNDVHNTDLQSSLKDIKEGFVISGDEEEGEEGDDDDFNSGQTPKLGEISVSASIDLPFGADIAFDAFSDLPRQPSWSSWLHSVSYLNTSGNKLDDYLIQKEEQEKRLNSFIENTKYVDVTQLRETKWVMGWKRIRFSWKSKVTEMERPKCIKWESTSGLKNMGVITFNERRMDNNQPGGTTQMTLTLKFVAPKAVGVFMKRTDKIEAYMTNQILQPTLLQFRDTVMVEDLGVNISNSSSQEATE